MRNKGLFFGLGLVLLTLIGVTRNVVDEEKTHSKIRTIELNDNSIDTNTILDTFIDCEIEESSEVIKITGLRKFEDINFAYDNVSDIIKENEFEDYISFEYVYAKSDSILTINAYQDGDTIIDDLNCYVFINEKQEKDALILCDDELFLLSDINDKYIENCGWFDKLIKSVAGIVVSAVVAPVVSLISPTAGVVTATAGAILTTAHDYDEFDVIEKKTAIRNYFYNLKQKEPEGFIYGQNYYSNWKFGYNTVDENGCGVVAAYNVLYGLGKRKAFAEVIYKFDIQGGKVLGGMLGADPTYMLKFFKNYNLECQSLNSYGDINKKIKEVASNYIFDSKEKWLIVCAWNGSSMTDGAHYIAAKILINGTVEVYNRYSNSTKERIYNSIDKSLLGGNLIAAYLIG